MTPDVSVNLEKSLNFLSDKPTEIAHETKSELMREKQHLISKVQMLEDKLREKNGHTFSFEPGKIDVQRRQASEPG